MGKLGRERIFVHRPNPLQVACYLGPRSAIILAPSCRLCISSLAPTQQTALCHQIRASRPVNRSIDASSAHQRTISCVYDCVHLQLGDVTFEYLYPFPCRWLNLGSYVWRYKKALPFRTERKGITLNLAANFGSTACRTPQRFSSSCPSNQFRWY